MYKYINMALKYIYIFIYIIYIILYIKINVLINLFNKKNIIIKTKIYLNMSSTDIFLLINCHFNLIRLRFSICSPLNN